MKLDRYTQEFISLKQKQYQYFHSDPPPIFVLKVYFCVTQYIYLHFLFIELDMDS